MAKIIDIELEETIKSSDEISHNNLDYIYDKDRINNDKLAKDLSSIEGKNCITVIDKVMTREDGSEMFEYIGMNATTMGGTQTIVENIFANINPESYLPLDAIKDEDLAAMDNWAFEPSTTLSDSGNDAISKLVPRKIFGIMIGGNNDGAIGSTVQIVDRRRKNFDLGNVIPFLRRKLSSDHPYDYLQIGAEVTGDADLEKMVHTYEKPIIDDIQHAIVGSGKYAGRIAIAGAGADNKQSAYLIKLCKFEFSNIMVDGTPVISNDDGRKEHLDVRSMVRMYIHINDGELSASYNQNNGDRDIRGSMISSIMLVAGRPILRSVSDAKGVEKTVKTYGDIIVTNKINFTEIPVEDTELRFRYTLYYV